MNSNLLFDFSVDKDNKAIRVKREFDASLGVVWDAWTKAELLDQWWAPKPFVAKTKSMDFRDGGTWLYAMVGPENVEHWCRADFKNIQQQKTYSALDAFCDQDGNVNDSFPRSNWQNDFAQTGDTTTVDITVSYSDLSGLEKILEMGFQEGFTAGLGNLDELLKQQSK